MLTVEYFQVDLHSHVQNRHYPPNRLHCNREEVEETSVALRVGGAVLVGPVWSLGHNMHLNPSLGHLMNKEMSRTK